MGRQEARDHVTPEADAPPVAPTDLELLAAQRRAAAAAATAAKIEAARVFLAAWLEWIGCEPVEFSLFYAAYCGAVRDCERGRGNYSAPIVEQSQTSLAMRMRDLGCSKRIAERRSAAGARERPTILIFPVLEDTGAPQLLAA